MSTGNQEQSQQKHGECSDTDKELLNDDEIINWKEEAIAIIKDVKAHVTFIEISHKLPNSESKVHLNLRTIEGEDYCVNVSSMGFRVVSKKFDTIDPDKVEMVDEEEVYETPYALLDKISPSYVESFGNQLCKQLLSLQQMRMQFDEEDEEGLDEDKKEAVAKAT